MTRVVPHPKSDCWSLWYVHHSVLGYGIPCLSFNRRNNSHPITAGYAIQRPISTTTKACYRKVGHSRASSSHLDITMHNTSSFDWRSKFRNDLKREVHKQIQRGANQDERNKMVFTLLSWSSQMWTGGTCQQEPMQHGFSAMIYSLTHKGDEASIRGKHRITRLWPTHFILIRCKLYVCTLRCKEVSAHGLRSSPIIRLSRPWRDTLLASERLTYLSTAPTSKMLRPLGDLKLQESP
jgi:hypothetical protein